MMRLIAAILAASSLTAAHAADAGRSPPGAGHTQRLVVQFRNPPAAPSAPRPAGVQRELAQADRIEALATRKALPLRRVRETAGGAVVVALPASVTLDQARAIATLLADDPAVVYVEPDVRVFAQQVPDPLSVSQWSLPGPADPGGSLGGINVTNLWPLAAGHGITVAVIDTGYTSHPDLDTAWLPGHDFVSTDPDGALTTANDGDSRDIDAADPGDWCSMDGANRPSSWHGTAVAGIIAAQANNGYGVVGAAPGVRILPVRAIGRCGGYMSDVVDAMRWAAGLPVAGAAFNPNPAKVLNLSLGSAPDIPCSVLQQRAVDEIVAAQVLIVAAAGNEGTSAIGAPANCNQVLAVAAHSRDGELAAYSNFHAAVALTAPGGVGATAATAIMAPSNAGATVPGLADPGRAFAGTSAATPHVAAAAALLWSLDPVRPLVEIRNALTSAARQWPAGTRCIAAAATGRCGAGMLDVGAAFARLGNQVTVDITAPGEIQAGNSAVVVTATARSSYAASQLVYRWIQTSGTPAVLANTDTANLHVTLPAYRTTVGLRVTVTDPLGGQTLDDAVIHVNNAPVAGFIGAVDTTPGATVVRYLTATDPDGDPVRYTLLQGPPGVTVGRGDGRLQWTASESGSYPVRVAVADAQGMRGSDIDIEIRVSDELSTASPLRANGTGSKGGGGAPGWVEFGLLGLALASSMRGRRKAKRFAV
jgi:serine protease